MLPFFPHKSGGALAAKDCDLIGSDHCVIGGTKMEAEACQKKII